MSTIYVLNYDYKNRLIWQQAKGGWLFIKTLSIIFLQLPSFILIKKAPRFTERLCTQSRGRTGTTCVTGV